ncbi:MAG TPA: trypsin-like peptidase domain-containing protein [Vicinamibacterales bacterium]|jgi:serine protease Do
MFRRLFLAGALVLMVLGAFTAGLLVNGWTRAFAAFRVAEPPPSVVELTPTRQPQVAQRSSPAAAVPGAPNPSAPIASGGPDFTRIAGQAVKGIANISSLQVVRTRNSPFSNDPFFSYFFGDQDAFGSRDRRSLSLGSGVFISADGYVVTNNHVVGENVREITIALPDKREIKGKVIGTDPTTDIALLKINVAGLPIVPWGDSSQLKVGEWVLAIGSPFQLSQTVTAGIVSATGRANMGFADYEDFIQTDAAINPGNSGGALINTRGELVGINTGIYSESGGYQGIGFAVPSNLARHVVDDLLKYGEVRRGSIGYIGIEKLTVQLAEEVGATGTNGALVSRMTRASEAYEAGIRPGDVIIGFNGQAIDDAGRFSRLVADARIGTVATVKLLRNGKPVEFKLPIVSSSTARTKRQ